MPDGSYEFGSAPSKKELARFDMNDLGNAMRLIRLAGGTVEPGGGVDSTACTLLYQIGAGWVGFNGRYWDRTYGEELARRMAHAVAREVRGMSAELMEAHGNPPIKDVLGFINKCGSSGATGAMLRQAQSYLTVEIDVFDRNPLALNCMNGTLKLRVQDGRLVRELRKHDPADRITKMAAVAYDDDAKAPLFRAVHKDSFPRTDEGAYFQRICGYGCTGLIREQAFFVNQGKGRDGKSTMFDACRKTLGTYAEVGDVKTFLEGQQAGAGGPSPDLVKLSGDVRFVVLSEPKRGAVWDESRLKSWTSGSPMTTRDLNAKNFNFKPVGKLFIECNPFPKPKGDDDGFWRRIKVVLFRRQVPEGTEDKDLPDKIEAEELPGILNWLLDGVEDWLCGKDGQGKMGLRPPPALVDFVQTYRRAASPFNDWLEDHCVWGDAAKDEWTGSSDLHRDFKDWCEAQGHDKDKVMSIRAFGDALADRQIMVKKDRRGNKVRGPIRLKTLLELQAEREAEAGLTVDLLTQLRPARRRPGRAPAGLGCGPICRKAIIRASSRARSSPKRVTDSDGHSRRTWLRQRGGAAA
jgi:putative DNA primase/helicase